MKKKLYNIGVIPLQYFEFGLQYLVQSYIQHLLTNFVSVASCEIFE